MALLGARGTLRRIILLYSRVLDLLLVVTLAILVLPVTLQVLARFSEHLPRYIWTEELSRFLLVWMIMIGAMIGVREGTHLTVDLWPDLKGRARATLDLVTGICVLAFAIVFLIWGWEFTDFAWYRISELAELPLWTIHIAWPVTGFTWLVFAGERMWDDLQVLLGREEPAP